MVISEAIGQQAALFCTSIFVGAGLFLLYDVLRIFRRVIQHGNIWIGVEDFFYWIVCTAVVFVMLYQENDGMVRGFALLGLVFGMAVYFLFLSRFIVRANVFILKKILGCVRKVLHFFFGPLIKRGKKVMAFLTKQLKKIAQAVKIGLCKL